MKKVLIFGFNGFVGPYLAKEFIKHNYKVVGSDISDFSVSKEIEYYKGDVLDANSIQNIVEKVRPSIIVNLAAISSVGQSWKMPEKTMAINVDGARNILEAASKLHEKPKVLFVGSSEEYIVTDKPINEETKIDANNPYGRSKIKQEEVAEEYRSKHGMQVYCVRSFNHTGVGQRDSFVLPSFCKQVAEIEKSKKDGVIYVGNLEVNRDFTDVKDIVRAYRLILEKETNDRVIYNVGSGKAYSLKELLNDIISFSSQHIEVAIDKEKYRPVDNPIICCDNSLIKKNIGWIPENNIKDTLYSMFKFYLGE